MSADLRAGRAADLLLAAWRGAAPLEALPADLRPQDEAQAYAIQHRVTAGLGAIGGWKVGAADPSPGAAMSCAALPASRLYADGALLSATAYTYRAMEAEICLRLGHDLPPREEPYTPGEAIAAVASCHPAIEILQTRYRDPESPDRLSALADSINHGAFIPGAAIPGWRGIDWEAEEVAMLVDGGERLRCRANPGGEMIRMLVWMANVGARPLGGLRAGQYVTTGSWIGKQVVGPSARVEMRFTRAGAVRCAFQD